MKYFSIRAGYSYNLFNLDETLSTGHGYIAGASISLGGFEVDFNYANRYAPLESIEGALVPTRTFLITGSFNEFWPKRD